MNKSTTTPTVSPLLNSYLYRFNLSLAEMKDRRAQEAESYGQVSCAKLLRFQRDQYLAEALKYAPVEIIAAQSFFPVTGNTAAFDVEKVEVSRG